MVSMRVSEMLMITPVHTGRMRRKESSRGRASAWRAAALQPEAAGGGGGRIDAVVAQHAAVLALGALRSDVALVEVTTHLVHRTIERVAVAGAAGQPKLENLFGGCKRHEGADAVVVDDSARPIKHHTAHRATGAPSEKARGPSKHSVGV